MRLFFFFFFFLQLLAASHHTWDPRHNVGVADSSCSTASCLETDRCDVGVKAPRAGRDDPPAHIDVYRDKASSNKVAEVT